MPPHKPPSPVRAAPPITPFRNREGWQSPMAKKTAKKVAKKLEILSSNDVIEILAKHLPISKADLDYCKKIEITLEVGEAAEINLTKSLVHARKATDKKETEVGK